MSIHIQNTEQAKSFVESYYSAETTNAYVCCTDAVYGVSQSKPSLRTKDIARLASEAFEYISKPKDLLHLNDAIERHFKRLDPAVAQFLRRIHFPFVHQLKVCVLLMPFTASFSLIATIWKIDRMITLEWLQNTLHSEQDFEGFDLLEKWLNDHPYYGESFKNVVFDCNVTLKKIQGANTLLDLLQIAGIGVYGYDFVIDGRIKEVLIDILKRKIETSSSQISSMHADQLRSIAIAIEYLGANFSETAHNLRERMKERMASETTLEGLVEVYGNGLSYRNTYCAFFKEKVERFVSSQVEHASTLEALAEIETSLISISYYIEGIRAGLQKLIDEKAKEIISSQDSIQKLVSHHGSRGAIRALIEVKIKEMLAVQVENIDSLEKLLKITKEPLDLVAIYFGQIIKDLKVWEKIDRAFFSEIEKAETLDKLNEIRDAVQSLPRHVYMFEHAIIDRKRSLFLREIRQAKALSQLHSLREKIFADKDLIEYIFDFQGCIAQRIAEMGVQEKALDGAVDRVKKCFRDIDDRDRELLKKLPPSDLLRRFAENISVSIGKRNFAWALGVSDFSDGPAVKSALKAIQVRLHPDKNEAEYRQVATKLWNVFTEIKKYAHIS